MMTIINAVVGCKFAQVNYASDVTLLGGKKNPLQGRVTKYVELNCQVNYDYENAVNNRLKKQGLAPTFKAQSLPWGTWLEFNKVITHKGENYLRIYTCKGKEPEVVYYVDGRLATDAEIAQIKATLPQKPKSGTQSAVGLDDNQVVPRDIKFSNIIKFVCNGQTYDNPNPRLVV